MNIKISLAIILLLLVNRTFSQPYVFYLHGAIVEGSATDPESGNFGRYEYTRIVSELKARGCVVISERRPANTIPDIYALKVSAQVDSLKNIGIPSDHITVIGASKGAVIAMLVSGLVKDKKVKYILMAGCNASNNEHYHFSLYGQVLSIYERSDAIGRSCNMIKKASQGISKYREIELSTGKQHGFIYTPLQEWMAPAMEWIEK